MDLSADVHPPTACFHEYFHVWPLSVENAPDRGRFLVAKRDIAEGEVVLKSLPYLTCILPSHKKRVCAYCLKDRLQRLPLCCSACSIAHYCSPECQHSHLHAHATGNLDGTINSEGPAHIQGPPSQELQERPSLLAQGAPLRAEGSPPPPPASMPHSTAAQGVPHAGPPVPHALLCPTLRRFASFKFDGDMAAILCMCLETLAIQHLQQQQQQQQQNSQSSEHQKHPAERGSHRLLGHDDFMLLTSSAVVSPQDKADWLKGARFLITAMQKTGWPGPLPSESQILDMSLKILSNNFGMWALKTRGAAPEKPTLPPSSSSTQCTANTPANSQGASPPPAASASTPAAHQTNALPLPLPSSSTQHTADTPPANSQGVCASPSPPPPAANGTSTPAAHTSAPPPPCQAPTSAAIHQHHNEHHQQQQQQQQQQQPQQQQQQQPQQQQQEQHESAHLHHDQQEQLHHHHHHHHHHQQQQQQQQQQQCHGSNGPGELCDRLAGLVLQTGGLGPETAHTSSGNSEHNDDPTWQQRPVQGGVPCGGAQDVATCVGSDHQECDPNGGFCRSSVSSAGCREQGCVEQGSGCTASQNGSSNGHNKAGEGSKQRGEPNGALHGDNSSNGSSNTTKTATKEELTGRQVYITASYFNHSCMPNCSMDHSGHVAVVRALQAIPAGTETCINYIDLDLPVFARRAELQRFFNFVCSCKRCLEEVQHGPAKVSWSRPQCSATEGSRAQKEKGKSRKNARTK